ncbi:MAG TPA: 3'-5' exonuclease [Ktedonobacteraceae bacterium]
MTHMNPNDFTDTYTQLTTLLAAQERADPPRSLVELQARRKERETLNRHLGAIEEAIAHLRDRRDDLPRLPRLEPVLWAQAVLALPNLAFLEVDTDGLHSDAEVLRVVLLAKDGTSLYSQLYKPRRPLTERTTHLTAIAPEMLEQAPSLPEEWERLVQAFAGRYIFSFNLEFDQSKLRENAERYGLTPVVVIGDCLMQRAETYYELYSYPKLSDLCSRIGFPLPEHPRQDASDRARGQIHLLEAMAQGITSIPAPTTDTEDAPVDQEDEDPFAPLEG